MKNVLADRRGGCVADGRLCRSRVAAKYNLKSIIIQYIVILYITYYIREFSRNFDDAVLQPAFVGVE